MRPRVPQHGRVRRGFGGFPVGGRQFVVALRLAAKNRDWLTDTDADSWDARKTKSDLIGLHSLIPHDWVIEAKAERKLSRAKLREGTAQLQLDGLVDSPHRRVLCGASLQDRVFMTLDIDTRYPIESVLPADPDGEEFLAAVPANRRPDHRQPDRSGGARRRCT